ncbi:mitochondrial ribosomal protein subunit Mrp10 [Protomyces lactucae-debilis]|uniref:Mitochondrial ribosomal protein subunit Mrp10 n=1 Tax=Protomyces lactucae-debilis TaxID=2754530 RepID=A0A1Y2FWM3_PROLT|nr:mitochondrial ribosomal protein subunit Mrp10 [Protomyces lactucae-debilis]ORY87055.1 mitochondrial ribosomal protein subunit Mrp10 [Protomyces lactucae-debilis]
MPVNKPPRLNLARLKVRPPKEKNAGPCAAEMAAMLGCWASHGDNPNAAECAAFATNLKRCMATGKQYVKKDNTINYHLARLGKLL